MSSTQQAQRFDGNDLSKEPPLATPSSWEEDSLNLQLSSLELESLSVSTLAIHADDPLNTSLADVAPPIHVSTTFRYPRDPSQLRPYHGRPGPNVYEVGEHCYSRHTTHNLSRFESILEALVKGKCLAYSSGLSAVHALLCYLNPRNVAIGDGYHGSHGVLAVHQRLSKLKVHPLDVNPEELGKGDLIMLETPINPTGVALDIRHYAEVAHGRGAYLSVDSTFAPPPLQDPFKHGADFVIHSGTKYIGGHSDMLAGVLAMRDPSIVPTLLSDRLVLGTVPGSMESWLGVRSIRTLELRVMRQSETATRIVDALSGALTGHTVGTGLSQSDVEVIKTCVKQVHHASLQSADLKRGGWLRKQMPLGFGPVFSIAMNSASLARRLPSKLLFFHHATSLGGVESLIEWRTMTDNTVAPDLLRISIGIEDERDLIEDLLRGFRGLIEEGIGEREYEIRERNRREEAQRNGEKAGNIDIL